MTTPKAQPCKNEEGYTVGVRDQIEADWMAKRTPAQIDALSRLNDERFCKVMQMTMLCGLRRMASKERILAKRAKVAKRKAKSAKFKKADSPYVDPRTLDVEPGSKILSDAGRRGGLAKGKAKAK